MQQPSADPYVTAVLAVMHKWARAVRARDLPGILRNHSDDVLMFDVPPPFEVRGLDGYAKTWELFFSGQGERVVFDFETTQVVAGDDVAFVAAAMRCMPCDHADPAGLAFRLTVGLRKIDGAWTIVHEHHSVPADD